MIVFASLSDTDIHYILSYNNSHNKGWAQRAWSHFTQWTPMAWGWAEPESLVTIPNLLFSLKNKDLPYKLNHRFPQWTEVDIKHSQ